MTNICWTRATPDKAYAEVIGDPIAHSKSPILHEFWLKYFDIDAIYRHAHVTTADLPAYFAARRADPLWRGCNVTIPHKLAILNHASDPDHIGARIGAANTVWRGNNRHERSENSSENAILRVTNTDIAGFLMPLAGHELTDCHAIVAGSGGAARAILTALKEKRAGHITILARNLEKAAALLADFGLDGDVQDFNAPLPAADIFINASPMGMTGYDAITPDWMAADLPDGAIIYDLVYTPLVTPLLKKATDQGLSAIGGLDMLLGQGLAAFELFYDHPIDDHQKLILRTKKTLKSFD